MKEHSYRTLRLAYQETYRQEARDTLTLLTIYRGEDLGDFHRNLVQIAQGNKADSRDRNAAVAAALGRPEAIQKLEQIKLVENLLKERHD